MKYKKIRPNKNEVYEIAYDDKCLVLKQGEMKIWISNDMQKWIAERLTPKE